MINIMRTASLKNYQHLYILASEFFLLRLEVDECLPNCFVEEAPNDFLANFLRETIYFLLVASLRMF